MYMVSIDFSEPFSAQLDVESTVTAQFSGSVSGVEGAPPACNASASGGVLTVTVQDEESGLQSITVTAEENTPFDPGESVTGFTVGTPEQFSFNVTRENPAEPAPIAFEVRDVAGNVTTCDPVITLVIRERGKPVRETFIDIPEAERFITVQNGDLGLKNLLITVNGQRFRMAGLRDNAERTLDVSSAMQPGDDNTITLMAWGKPGSSATVVISD